MLNIVLIGYRGCGKSVVAALLAKKLHRNCYGMDKLLVERAGCSIPEYVDRHGWPAFRDMESNLAYDLAAKENAIIDCGGGIIEREENIIALRTNGQLFWLQASVETIIARIGGDSQRPALTEGKSFTEEVAEVLAARTPRYQAAANFTIDTDELTPEEIVEIICAQLEE